MSVRTAMRNFDLQLAIYHPPSLCRDWNEFRKLPVVYGGNSAGFFVALALVW